MVAIVRSVSQLSNDFRKAIEHAVGQPLRDEQQVTIQVNDPQETDGGSSQLTAPAPGPLPEWCGVYEGLSADEIAALETVVLQRADLSRPVD
jgi:hypothetical protein